MAAAADKARRKKIGQDWSTNGSFINKPAKGWLHPDDQLKADAGICYGVRYVGCMEVKQSMKSLDFETRTAVAKESISRVCETAGLKLSPKKVKKSKVSKLLGEQPNMIFAGANVNLTITTECITIMIMESGEIIANHQMPGISFASGGDPDTMDFVAYVAKDEMFGRACHVLECGGGLAQDVITTIGQAFEIRFKQFLAKRPHAVSVPNRQEMGPQHTNAWGDDTDEREYYNDRPGAQPPDDLPPYSESMSNYVDTPSNISVPQLAHVAGGRDTTVEFEDNALYDKGENTGAVYDNRENEGDELNVYDNSEKDDAFTGQTYDNKVPSLAGSKLVPEGSLARHVELPVYDNKAERGGPAAETHPVPTAAAAASPPLGGANKKTPQAAAVSPVTTQAPQLAAQLSSNGVSENSTPKQNGKPDQFDMTPFCSSLPSDAAPPTASSFPVPSPHGEVWFHGKITRQQVEELLVGDGDFLVRESTHSPGQYVLSGRHQGRIKHLLLIDPEGVVRTKDRTFDSIAHLIEYHVRERLPITSSDSEIVLRNPITR